MSHYISSFLIEPVVRQARRFSRPANDTSPGNDEVSRRSDELATAAAAAHEGQIDLRIDTRDHSVGGTIAGSPEAMSTTSDEGLVDGGLQSRRDGESHPVRLELLETNNLEPAVHARQYTVQNADDTSDNPLYRLPDDFMPTRSSTYNSTRSMIGASMLPEDSTVPPSRRMTGEDSRSGAGSQEGRALDGSLPADDGMGPMRKRIIAIQRTNSSNEEKARLVHSLMRERHTSQQSLHRLPIPRAPSPSSLQSSERPFTPSSPKSMESLRQTLSPPTSSSSTADSNNPFQLTPEDLKPTFYKRPAPVVKEGDNERRSSDSEEEPKALGCAHYKRNIKLQCSACHRWYTCRFCHDAIEDHMLNRRETKNMLCMLCGCAQPAAEECALCSERGAWYYCDVCKLWDDDPQKSIYHCNDCGICRVGQGLGKDFYHCITCCVCMSISIRDTHRCIERSTDCDCPICGEYMFTSPQTVVFMRCGHSIHQQCYNEHMKSSYRCPICSRSIVNMESQFNRLERAIDSQPMPPEFQDTQAWVYCNDCSAKTAVKYHWLGLKCGVCDSYNTAQIQILSGPDPGAHSPSTPGGAPPTPPSHSPFTSRDPSRGRPQQQSSLHTLRSGNSAPPAASTIELNPPRPRRTTHSATPHTTASFRSSSLSSAEEGMDTSEDEYDEVDFWGGETGSPPPPEQPRQVRRREHMDVDGNQASSDEEEESEDEDEDMSDDDDEDDDDDNGVDRMEIFGHR